MTHRRAHAETDVPQDNVEVLKTSIGFRKYIKDDLADEKRPLQISVEAYTDGSIRGFAYYRAHTRMRQARCVNESGA